MPLAASVLVGLLSSDCAFLEGKLTGVKKQSSSTCCALLMQLCTKRLHAMVAPRSETCSHILLPVTPLCEVLFNTDVTTQHQQ
jgi:hypothetical protein